MQNLRFVFVDTLLLLRGEMYRQDFTPDKMIYPLSTAQCTRMMKDYLSVFPDQTQYDSVDRRYRVGPDFKAVLLPGDTLEEKKENAQTLVDIFKKIGGDLKAMKAAYAEALIVLRQGFNVPELEETFALSKPQVTRDLMAYRKEYPNQMNYDHSVRHYIPLSGFNAPVLSKLYGKRGLKARAMEVIEDVSWLRMLDERAEELIANAI